MSTLSLKKNGCTSSSKCTKHIKAKYFFIQHYHQSNEKNLQYCPTDSTWADVLTKRLQGSKFQQKGVILMNCLVDYHEEPPMISPILVSSSPIFLIKPQIHQIKPLLRECVEVSSPTISKYGGRKTNCTLYSYNSPCPAWLRFPTGIPVFRPFFDPISYDSDSGSDKKTFPSRLRLFLFTN